MNCNYCQARCIKKGFYKTVQRYCCRQCNKYQQAVYVYTRCTDAKEQMLVVLNNLGLGITGISKAVGISKSNVINKIKKIAAKIVKPVIKECSRKYEMDELQTYIGNKGCQIHVIYAINRDTRQVIDCVVGRRTAENIAKVVNSLKSLRPEKIYTDRLNIYPSLIAPSIHHPGKYGTNRIERKNLTLRTHLKRLNRKTVCYSKSAAMLEACLKLYFWYGISSKTSTKNAHLSTWQLR